MSAPSTSGLSVKTLLPVIDIKYGRFTLLYFKMNICSHGKKNLLFLPYKMAAVQNHYTDEATRIFQVSIK